MTCQQQVHECNAERRNIKRTPGPVRAAHLLEHRLTGSNLSTKCSQHADHGCTAVDGLRQEPGEGHHLCSTNRPSSFTIQAQKGLCAAG